MSLIDIKSLRSLIEHLEHEKRIPKEVLVEALESALAAAYKKDFGKKDHIIRCTLNLETGDTEFFQVKTAVDDTTTKPALSAEEIEQIKAGTLSDLSEPDDIRVRFNSERHILVDDARRMKQNVQLGDEILFPLDEPESDFGRVAAQTAKQVIAQKLRDAERDSVTREYIGKVGEIVTGTVQRFDRGTVMIDLGRAIGYMDRAEKLPGEFYTPGKAIRAYLFSAVSRDGERSRLELSRSHPEFLKKLFSAECPEIANGLVEIKSIAREPGNKTKIAVASNDDSVDPIGACVGQKGSRVNAVSLELNNEKIDIIPWSPDAAEFIANAIAPADPMEITLDESKMEATVMVADDKLSLAIGRGGQNARLAAKLTGWKIDIIGDGSMPELIHEKNQSNPVVDVSTETSDPVQITS